MAYNQIFRKDHSATLSSDEVKKLPYGTFVAVAEVPQAIRIVTKHGLVALEDGSIVPNIDIVDDRYQILKSKSAFEVVVA